MRHRHLQTARPAVLRCLTLLGIPDAALARLLGVTRGLVNHWARGRQPIAPATHSKLWHLVLALTVEELPYELPRGVVRPDGETARMLGAAAYAALRDAPDAESLAAGSQAVLEVLARLDGRAKAEREAERSAAKALTSVERK